MSNKKMRKTHAFTCNLYHTWRKDGQFLPLNYGKPGFSWKCTCGLFDEIKELPQKGRKG